jgi:hypothetical protein
MQKKNKSKKKSPAPWGQITLGGFRAEFPRPRIPRLLGAAQNLGNAISVYPNGLELDVPILQQFLTIVAGALAGVIPIDTTIINAFGARFGAVFKEYAIVGAKLELRPNNMAVTSGMTGAYLDENSNAAPTAGTTANVPRLDLLNAPLFDVKPYLLTWTPRDLLDLDYVPVATNFTPVWLKLFTDQANFGSQATTTGQWVVTGSLAFQFRGYI